MARGWESKAVEAQQDAASEQRQVAPALSRSESDRRALRATLQLARTRAAADLARASAPAHREMLTKAIAELDARISDL